MASYIVFKVQEIKKIRISNDEAFIKMRHVAFAYCKEATETEILFAAIMEKVAIAVFPIVPLLITNGGIATKFFVKLKLRRKLTSLIIEGMVSGIKYAKDLLSKETPNNNKFDNQTVERIRMFRIREESDQKGFEPVPESDI